MDELVADPEGEIFRILGSAPKPELEKVVEGWRVIQDLVTLPGAKPNRSTPCAMGSNATLVAASQILPQYIQQFGLDPFLGTPCVVDDFPSLVVSLILIEELEQLIVGTPRAAVGGGADLDRFL